MVEQNSLALNKDIIFKLLLRQQKTLGKTFLHKKERETFFLCNWVNKCILLTIEGNERNQNS